ncbi:type VI secretion protein [Bradyrhizobium sp. UASWS1016]|jgi:type IV secretion system protein VirB8|uniref:virB8 family protein n=1 Tax=Bradyrhizobium sp. UASWS1016 TaxID=1566379 RepID=UPI0008562167|nr:virB8 family protein [Bradyrhizobium sp. UASWS1016]OCX32502.1 type VI secretion protein [Bradyrhizobium sp. UASWS1016]OYU86415.1 MAG: type VI secretion protein [Bradyrhizobiaceae bacterium PARB1]
MTEMTAAEPTRVDPRYYADGATWERDIARRNRNSRALAWIVAAVMTIVAVGALGTLALLVPLKTYEPYMVVVDKTTGFVEVKRPMAEGPLSQDEAVTTFNVVRYIKARETYDPKALKDNFDLAQLLASGDASRELTEIYSPANPNNPVKVFGSNTVISVNIKSVTFPNNRTALARFSTEEKSSTNIITRNWVSLVRFRYTSAPMRNEWRFDNPLGFQVLEYRRDQETAPSPGTAGAQQ